MRNFIFLFAISLIFFSCSNEIKNTDTKVEIEEGTSIDSITNNEEVTLEAPTLSQSDSTKFLLGSYVGFFKVDSKDDYNEKTMYIDEGYVWNRENKINISIDTISGNSVIGHSVVAGNDRPFKGSIQKSTTNEYNFTVEEPGDDKYDGKFIFTISPSELSTFQAIGKWSCFKDIEIKNRKFTLEKKIFKYNPDQKLVYAKAYVNWKETIESKMTEQYDDEIEEWVAKEYSSATSVIYEINASNTVLYKEDLENLKKGDLIIIRNAIFARHGYSFKNRTLRVFFDAQPWYIPIYADIRDALTDIEKENIIRLLKYEKNAKEYYDTFGRG